MGKFGLSATEIGRSIGASREEVNRLLRDQGFLEGKPSAWSLTTKGEEYGIHRDHDNGYGGFAHRNWYTTHFDPSVVEVIDSSPEQIAKARAEIAADRQAQRAARAAEQAEAEARYLEEEAERARAAAPDEIDLKKLAIVAGSILAAIGVGTLVYKGIEWRNRKRAARKESDREPGAPSGPEGE